MATELLELANLISAADLWPHSHFSIFPHLDPHISHILSALDHTNHQAIALLAQAKGQFNQDVVGDIAKGWNNFIRTGQWAALLIGLTIGYMFRVFTSSG